MPGVELPPQALVADVDGRRLEQLRLQALLPLPDQPIHQPAAERLVVDVLETDVAGRKAALETGTLLAAEGVFELNVADKARAVALAAAEDGSAEEGLAAAVAV